MPSYKSPMKMVEGGEGDRCKYPLRLDTYGRGCANDCEYFLDIFNYDTDDCCNLRKGME